MAQISITIDETVEYCKKMNSARRNILTSIARMKTMYSNISTNDWSGQSRKDFHKTVFGEDGNSGLLGIIGNGVVNGKKGMCAGLNDLLYVFAVYVSNIANLDSVYTTKNGFLRYDMFVDDKVTVEPVSNFIEYSSISDNIINIKSDVINALSKSFSGFCADMNQQVIDFRNTLKQLQSKGITDDSLNALDIVSNELQKLASSVFEKIKKEAFEKVEIADSAMKEKAAAIEKTEAVNNILKSLGLGADAL